MNIVFLNFPFFLSDIAEAFSQLGHQVKILKKKGMPGEGIEYDFNDDIQKAIKKNFPRFYPDILFFSSNIFTPYQIEKLPFTTVAWFNDSHIHFDIWEKHYYLALDFVFLAQKYYVEKAKKLGIKRCFWVPWSCYGVDFKKYSVKREFDIGFVGHMGGRFFRNRYLNAFSKRFKTNFQTGVYGEKKTKVLQSAKILFNRSLNNDLNPRVFESLAAGGMLLTDKAYPMDEFFEEGKHLVYYKNLSEALKKTEYYLNRPKEREKIALAGQKLLLKKHTPFIRTKEMLQILEESDYQNAYKTRLKGPKLYYHLGRAYFGIGYKERTIEYLKRFLQVKPGFASRQQIKARFFLLFRTYGGNFLNRLIRFLIRFSSIYGDKLLRKINR